MQTQSQESEAVSCSKLWPPCLTLLAYEKEERKLTFIILGLDKVGLVVWQEWGCQVASGQPLASWVILWLYLDFLNLKILFQKKDDICIYPLHGF